MYRVQLPVRNGEIGLGDLEGAPRHVFPDGCTVVLDVGAGEWISRARIEELGRTLLGTRHVSVSGTRVPWGVYGASDQYAVRGLDMIAYAIQGAMHRAEQRRSRHETSAATAA